jgi:hypothetical protein
MKIFTILFYLFISTHAFAEKITLLVSLSPAGSFQAESKKLKGDVFFEKGIFYADRISVSIESFKTGIELRDEHFWKHLNSKKHPKATLLGLKAQSGQGSAILEINGIKKKVTISYDSKNDIVIAKFRVKASEFGLPKAEYLGVGVSDDVEVQALLPYKKR